MGTLTKKHNLGAFTVVVAACMMALLWAVFYPVSGDQGGTDEHIETFGESGGGGAISWNEVHGFAIAEDDEKIGETFNVTLCEKIKEDKDGFNPSGTIYGELHDIIWDDQNPVPSLVVSQEDFDSAEKSDEWTLELKVLGEYIREADSPGQEDEVRQAWKSVTVTRPNHAPRPVFEITNTDEDDNPDWSNWSLVEVSDTELIYYITSVDIDVEFIINASLSTDEDGDDVTEFMWDLDDDGEFGGQSYERKMNTSFFKGEGDYTIGLIVGDGDKYSDPLDLIITIRQPIRYPDLDLFDLHVVNRNGNEEIEKGDRCSLDTYVRNSGDTKFEGTIEILYEYWFMDGSAEPYWEELETLTVDRTLEVNEFGIFGAVLETGEERFVPGRYAFRATVDPDDDLKELRELNNQFEVLNITIGGGCISCDVDLTFEFVSIDVEENRIWKSNVTDISVTIKNTGDYTAQWVDLKYFVEGSEIIMTTFSTLDPDEEGIYDFVFTENVKKTFSIHFQILDNGEIKKTSQIMLIEVIEPPIEYNWTNKTLPNGNEDFPYLIVVAGAILIIVPTLAAVFWTRKKNDDDVW